MNAGSSERGGCQSEIERLCELQGSDHTTTITTTALTHWSCLFTHWKKFTQWPIGSVHCSHIGNTTHCLLEYCIESFHTQRRESCGHTQSVNVLNPQNCRRVHSSAKYLCASLEPSEPLGRRILTNMGTAASPDGLPS